MSENKLAVTELHKRYGDHEVLKGVSLAANAGDVISIIGSSGSGKSTFLRCINFLEKPSEGSISLNNEDIRMVRDKDGQLKVFDKKQLQLLRTRLPTLEGARLRLRPIVMTSLAFVAGVIPLALSVGAGAASRREIGIAVIGGMISGTLLTLLFVPLFFVLTKQGLARLKARK